MWPTTLNNLAIVYGHQGKYADAEALYKRALAIEEKALGKDHPDVAYASQQPGHPVREARQVRRRRGALQARAGDPREGARQRPPRLWPRPSTTWPSCTRAKASTPTPRGSTSARWRSRRRRSAQTTPMWLRPSTTWPSCTRSQGKYADAEGLYKRALAIYEKALGADHPDVARTLNNLAGVYETQGKYADAEGLYKRALAIEEKALGADHPDVAATLNNLADVYREQGKYADAEALYKRALAIDEKALGADHPDVARTLNNLAILSASSGNGENALAYSRKATAAVIAHAASETTGAQHKRGGRSRRAARELLCSSCRQSCGGGAEADASPRRSSAAKLSTSRNGRSSPRPRPRSSKWACALPPAAMRLQRWCASARTSPPSGASATRR